MAKQGNSGFTGRHMAIVLVAFFAVVIGVNLLMARYATSTFGGVVVENSYVASQKYNGWLKEAREEKALGWEAQAAWRPDGHVALLFDEVPAGAVVVAEARHPLGRKPDKVLHFDPSDAGRYISRETLEDGRWTLRLEVTGNGRKWRKELTLQ